MKIRLGDFPVLEKVSLEAEHIDDNDEARDYTRMVDNATLCVENLIEIRTAVRSVKTVTMEAAMYSLATNGINSALSLLYKHDVTERVVFEGQVDEPVISLENRLTDIIKKILEMLQNALKWVNDKIDYFFNSATAKWEAGKEVVEKTAELKETTKEAIAAKPEAAKSINFDEVPSTSSQLAFLKNAEYAKYYGLPHKAGGEGLDSDDFVKLITEQSRSVVWVTAILTRIPSAVNSAIAAINKGPSEALDEVTKDINGYLGTIVDLLPEYSGTRPEALSDIKAKEDKLKSILIASDSTFPWFYRNSEAHDMPVCAREPLGNTGDGAVGLCLAVARSEKPADAISKMLDEHKLMIAKIGLTRGLMIKQLKAVEKALASDIDQDGVKDIRTVTTALSSFVYKMNHTADKLATATLGLSKMNRSICEKYLAAVKKADYW